MMISVDRLKCRQCGKCINLMKGYCISEKEAYPVFDADLCNTCQKCVAICPHQAILVNGVAPTKINGSFDPNPQMVYSILERRRSIKHFQKRSIPREVVEKIISTAKYAPNQNKNISVHVIDDKQLIELIDDCAIRFVKKMYAFLFNFKIIELIVSLFYRDIKTIKRKMEYGSFKRVVIENTQVIIIVSGDRKVAVTESSAHYMLATMMFMAESLGVGNCLMDSVYLALRLDKRVRRKLGIEDDVLGSLVMGFSDEKIVNIPRGYEVPILWNTQATEKGIENRAFLTSRST